MLFYADINSELYDQVNITDTIQIWCNTTAVLENIKENTSIIHVNDVLGRIGSKNKTASLRFVRLLNGTTEKRLIITE